MKIEKLTEENKELWKEFVGKNKDSKFYHSLKFKEVIEKTYKNCKAKYFFLINKNKVESIFPFFMVKSKLLGNRLISLPFVDNGGFLGKYDKEIIKKLIENFKKKENIKQIEIRSNSSLENFKKDEKIFRYLNFKEDQSKQQFIIKLTSKENMWKKFHKHTRNDIRKAEKSNLSLKELISGKEIKKFYKLYIRNLKFFGTPQHSYKFFKNLFEIMNENVIGFNCYYKNKIIGSIIILYSGKYGYVSHNVSNIKYRKYRPNDILYWKIIKLAMEKKIKYLDLGQIDKDSSNAQAIGLYKFKRKWLGNVYGRVYFYYNVRKDFKDAKERKDKLKKFRKVWKRIPIPILKIIGPKIASQLAI